MTMSLHNGGSGNMSKILRKGDGGPRSRCGHKRHARSDLEGDISVAEHYTRNSPIFIHPMLLAFVVMTESSLFISSSPSQDE
jgi:hypothetical protein